MSLRITAPRAAVARIVCAVLAAAAFAGCGSKVQAPGPPPPAPRGFAMALTPFPAEITIASFQEAVDFAATHGDVVSNHHDDGVPWAAMLAGEAPPANLVANFAYRRDRGAPLGARSYVSLTWLTSGRDSLAKEWGGAPWPPAIAADPTFANPDVRRALTRWCAWMATFYQPDRFSPGIEINFYAASRPADWPALVSLYREIRDTLATIDPAMEVFPTFQLERMRVGAQWSLVSAFEDRMDALAFSTYPGANFGPGGFWTPADIPDDYLSGARALTASTRPMLISETGFADSLLVPPGWQGSPQMQQDYLAWMIGQADSLDLEQVTWFFPSDCWALLAVAPPGQQDLIRFFASMGLRTRSLAAKPVQQTWDAAHARPYQP
jgi:hypothetical protein